MMPSSRRLHRLAHNLTEVDFGFFPASLLIPGAPRSQHLLHGFRQAVGVAQHEPVELLLLRFRQIAALQGFKMQTDRRHGSFQFVSDSVDETVVLLAPPNLMHQEAGVYDHAGDDESKEDDAEEQQHALPPVENDPSNIERNRQGYEGDAQAKKEYDRSAAARDAHSFRVILPRSEPWVTEALMVTRAMAILRQQPVISSDGSYIRWHNTGYRYGRYVVASSNRSLAQEDRLGFVVPVGPCIVHSCRVHGSALPGQFVRDSF